MSEEKREESKVHGRTPLSRSSLLFTRFSSKSSSADCPLSLHAIGSKTLGGAEGFFLRLIAALARRAPVAALVRKGSEVEAAIPEGIPVRGLPLRTVWDPLSKMEYRRAVSDIAPQVVQTYMGRATRLLRRSDVPHIARLGGYYKLSGYRHADAWVGNTQGVCDYLRENGFPPSRIFHIPNFVPLPKPRTGRTPIPGVPEGAKVLLHAGRFVPVKGHRLLLEALARLPGDVWLVLLGSGPLEGQLREEAERLGVAQRVVWAGWQSDPAPFYAAADLVVFPSLEGEALGNVILEAWAQRLPVVVTRFRGAREITRHGTDAWQVPCGDARRLAEAIHLVLGDPDLGKALAEAGHRRILTEFSEERVVQAYLELYRRFS